MTDDDEFKVPEIVLEYFRNFDTKDLVIVFLIFVMMIIVAIHYREINQCNIYYQGVIESLKNPLFPIK